MEQITKKASDGYPLSIHIFDIPQPKAVVQIVHGMEEHQERYENFATFLNEHGFAVVTSDLRGHGKNAEIPGHFKDKDGHIALVNDQKRIRKFIGTRYPELPVLLFAHSMGTIISRVLLQAHSMDYEKVALSGYPNYQAGALAGIVVTTLLRKLRGATYKSAFVEKNTVGVFNKAVPNPKTDFDWLCSNPATVQAYIRDPYCGIGFTCSAFHDLFSLVMQMHKPNTYRQVHHDMPLLMLRGTDDPCTGKEKGAADSNRVLAQAGFHRIKRKDYPGMRHEILNEKDASTVYEDILRFFND